MRLSFFFFFFLFAWAPSALSDSLPENARLRIFLHDFLRSSEEVDSKTRAMKLKLSLFANNDLLQQLLTSPSQREKILADSGFGSALRSQSGVNELFAVIDSFGLKNWGNLSSEEKRKLISAIPDKFLSPLPGIASKLLDNLQISKLPALQIVISEIQAIDMPGLSAEDRAFMGKAFLSYFDKLPAKMKRRMILAWLALSPDSSPARQLAEVLQNSGPALQKFFQLLGKQAQGGDLKAITAELLSSIKPEPFENVRALIEAEYGKPIDQIFRSVEEKPLGSASVGQVHRGITLEGDEVIIKVIKPGVPEAMMAEIKVLREVMKDNKPATDLINAMTANFLLELDLRNEALGLTRGLVYEDKKLGISVPKIVTSLPPKERVMLMTVARGTDLGKSAGLDPLLRAQVVVNVLQKWFGEAMFGDGFFHGDLHPGNIMVVSRPENNPAFLATVIDFGGRGELSHEQRAQMLYYFAALQDGRLPNVIEALASFGDLSNVDYKKLDAEVTQILTAPGIGIEQKMNEVLGASMKLGAKFDDNILLYGRAGLFLANELQSINLEIRAKYPKQKLISSEDVYQRVGVRSLARELLDRILGRHRGQFMWDSEMIKTMIKANTRHIFLNMRSNCEKIFRALEAQPLVF